MAEERNVLLGILSILLGIIVIAFPLISVFILSSIVVLDLYLLVSGYSPRASMFGAQTKV